MLPGWTAMVAASWRFGLGGSTAHASEFGDALDVPHTLDRLRLRAGSVSPPGAIVRLSLAYNQQDYETPAAPATAADADGSAAFGFGVPAVHAVEPSRGFASGGTQLRVSGDLPPTDRNLDESGGWRCRFLEIVHAGWHAGGASGASGAEAPGYAALPVTLSPLDLWASRFDYARRYRGEAEAGGGGEDESGGEGESEGDGKDKGGAAEVSGGAARGDGVWRVLTGGASATVAGLSDGGAVACTAPALAHGRYSVQLSLHGARWSGSTDAALFLSDGHAELKATPDEAPVAAEPLDPAPPLAMRVLLSGVALHGGFAYTCQVRPAYAAADGAVVTTVKGTYASAVRGVLCELPQPGRNGTGAIFLHLSLGSFSPLAVAEPYGSSGALFQWRPPATISAQLPNPAGPARGATQLTLVGGGFGVDADAAVECRFGAATVRAARASDTSVACLTPEARWAGLMLGAPEGSPRAVGLGPDLSGPWSDSEGRRLHVCAMHGGLAVAVPEAGAAAVAVWDVQRRGYVGMWQQWQPLSGAPNTLSSSARRYTLFGAELGAGQRHERGFFRWRVATEGEAVIIGGARVVVGNQSEAGMIAGVWTSHRLRRHFDSVGLGVGANDRGEWSAVRAAHQPPPPPSPPFDGNTTAAAPGSASDEEGLALACSMLQPSRLQVDGGFALRASAEFAVAAAAAASATTAAALVTAAATSSAAKAAAARQAAQAEQSRAGLAALGTLLDHGRRGSVQDATAAPSPPRAMLALVEAALGRRSPLLLLGSATLHPMRRPAAPLAAPPTPSAPPDPQLAAETATNETNATNVSINAAMPPVVPPLPSPPPFVTIVHEQINLTTVGSHGLGGAVWQPESVMAAAIACRQDLRVFAEVYAGGGQLGGEGIVLALGSFAHVQLLALPRADTPAAFGDGDKLLVLRLRRTAASLGGLELLVGGRRLARLAFSLPTVEWTSVALSLTSESASPQQPAARLTRLTLRVGGAVVLAAVPLPGWQLAPSWRLGLSAAALDGQDTHAVRSVGCSCGEGAGESAALPLAVSADSFHASYRSRHAHYAYYAEPALSLVRPAVGHLSGGALLAVQGAGLHRGVDFRCALGDRPWSAATYRAAVDAVVCRAPPSVEVATAALRLTLNGQQLSAASLPFHYVNPQPTSLYPTSGPTIGRTIVAIRPAFVNGSSLSSANGSSLDLAPLGLLGSTADERWRTAAAGPFCSFNSSLSPASWSEAEGALKCASPRAKAVLTGGVVLVGVSMNGQDLTPAPLNFTYFSFSFDADELAAVVGGRAGAVGVAVELAAEQLMAALPLRSVDRASGPVEGGTFIVAYIGEFDAAAASDPVCRFVDRRGTTGTTPAVISSGSDALQCATPAGLRAGPAAIEVSLNAQDFSVAGHRFCFTNASLVTFEPLVGPVDGGTRLLLRGAGLVPYDCHLAADLEPKVCRWTSDSASFLDGAAVSATVAATVDAGRAALVCFTPPLRLADETVPAVEVALSASLNGRDYTPPLTYSFARPVAISEYSPACGPTAGGTTVQLSGVGLRAEPRLACSFGAREVRATLGGGPGVASCVSPNLHDAAAVPPKRLDDPSAASAAVLANAAAASAAALASVSPMVLAFGGEVAGLPAALRSSGAALYHLGGVAALGPSALQLAVAGQREDGHLQLVLPNGEAPLSSFDLDLAVRFVEDIATAATATTTSTIASDSRRFALAAEAEAEAEAGAEAEAEAEAEDAEPTDYELQAGVVEHVDSIPTFDQTRHEIMLKALSEMSAEVAAVPAPASAPVIDTQIDSEKLSAGGVILEYGPQEALDAVAEAAASSLELSLGVRSTAGLSLRLALSAKTGVSLSVLVDGVEAVPPAQRVAVVLGLPYGVGLGLSLSLSTTEGLRVRLAGVSLCSGLALRGWHVRAGWHFRLRSFGHGSVGVELSRLRLLSAATLALTPLNTTLTIGPIFSSAPLPFIYYAPPLPAPAGGCPAGSVHREPCPVLPLSGPLLGGTLVSVALLDYAATHAALIAAAPSGADLRCRFGAAESPATHWVEAGQGKGLSCVAPPLTANGTSLPHAVRMVVTLNGQQFSRVAAFVYHAEPSGVLLSPRAGPAAGGALLTLVGAGLGNGSAPTCRFSRLGNETRVAATWRDAPSRLQCVSPPVVAGLPAATVDVSLNAQQFFALPGGGEGFVVVDAVSIVSATPLSGPGNGGTTVEVALSGRGVLNPASAAAELGSYLCAFGHAERTADDEMIASRHGVTAATYVNDSLLRCASPSSEDSGAGWYGLSLAGSPLAAYKAEAEAALLSELLGAAVPSGGGAVRLTDDATGACGAALLDWASGALGSARALWFEQTLELRTTPQAPPWGQSGRVLRVGGFSWSYGQLPAAAARGVVGALGVGLGLRVLLAPKLAGAGVAWQVVVSREVVGSGMLPEAVLARLQAAEWVAFTVRHPEWPPSPSATVFFS